MKLLTFGLLAFVLASPLYAADKVTYNDALNSWKTGAGANKPIPDADTLKNWKDNVLPPKSNSGLISEVLWSNPNGMSTGNFVLSKPYFDFDYIHVHGTNDHAHEGGVTVWESADITYHQSIHSSGSALRLWYTDKDHWTGRFASDGKRFTTSYESSKLWKIVGYKRPQ